MKLECREMTDWDIQTSIVILVWPQRPLSDSADFGF